MKSNNLLFILFLFAFGALNAAYSQAGALDLSFNDKGYSIEAFAGSGRSSSSAIQPDGKIVLVGYGTHGQTYGFMAVRLNPDGSLDPSFGENGKVITTFGGTSYWGTGVTASSANAVAIQSDGKIVLVGTVTYRRETYGSLSVEIGLIRYNPDGSLDNTFDGDGKLRSGLSPGGGDRASAIAIAPDGKIVIAGSEPGAGMLVMRFNTDGTHDNGFDGDGKVNYAAARDASAIVIQPDGKIVVAGIRYIEFDHYFETVRFNPNGAIDNTFNGTGVAPVPNVTGWHSPHSLLLQPDGKIIVEGKWNSYTALMRYNPDGSFDNSFGVDGFAYLSFTDAVDLTRAALLPDGKIVLATSVSINSASGSNMDFKICRLNPDGSKDTSFNGTATVTTAVGKADDIVAGVVAQPDGKIVLTGYTSGGGDADKFAAVRYGSDGSPDNSYGSGGRVQTSVGFGGGSISAITVQNDGKIIAAGDGGLARYNTGGHIDTSFNGTGTIPAIYRRSAKAIAVDPDGKIVAVGDVYDGTYHDTVIFRYNSNGSVDDGFGIQGQVITSLGATIQDYFTSVALQADGKIVAAGYTYMDSTYSGDIAIIRFNPDGSRDGSFGDDGKVLSHPCSAQAARVSSVVIQADGRIVVSGNCEVPVVARFNADGSPDASFNGMGAVSIPGVYGNASDIELQSDGRIVVAGYSYPAAGADFLLARLLPNGSLDPSFNGTGVVIQSVGGGDDWASSLLIQSDGKLVAAGYGKNRYAYEFKVLRFNNDGSLDSGSWGDHGVATLSFQGDGYAYAAALDAEGRVLVGGYAGGLFGIARFTADAAPVSFASVSGRVTDSNGNPISRAIVSITDSNGLKRTAQTNAFGYYRFDDVQIGSTYIFSVSAKRYRFSPQTVTVGGELTGLDFVPNN